MFHPSLLVGGPGSYDCPIFRTSEWIIEPSFWIQPFAVRIQRKEGRRKRRRKTRGRLGSSFRVPPRREREKKKGERTRRRTVRRGVREEGGTSVGCRKSVRKISQLVQLEKMKD